MKASAKTRALYQIGEVADRADLSLRTVRYYEETALVSPCDRTEGGFRLYGENEIQRLLVIKQMKPLGFTLEEMRELLAARDELEVVAPDTAAHARLLERVAKFAAQAKKKTDKLRRHVNAGEQLVSELQGELRRQRKRAA
jgi:DNA-binding transcriptional MerR regulator